MSGATKVSKFLVNSHKWCTNGTIAALPLTIKLLHDSHYYLDSQRSYVLNSSFKMTKTFFKSTVGKKLLEWKDKYLISVSDLTGSRQVEKQALNTILESEFESGMCYGEVAAVMIANQPKYTKNAKSMLLKVRKMHVIFFQAMSNLRWLYRRYYDGEVKNVQVTGKENICPDVSRSEKLKKAFLDYFNKSVDGERAVLESIASIKFIKKLSLDNFSLIKDRISQLIRDGAHILRFVFPYYKDAHSICVFLDPCFQIYDSLVGIVEYKTEALLLADLARYFERSKNSLEKLTIEVFNRV